MRKPLVDKAEEMTKLLAEYERQCRRGKMWDWLILAILVIGVTVAYQGCLEFLASIGSR